jgi:hypothetical protein
MLLARNKLLESPPYATAVHRESTINTLNADVLFR